jgi:hypothetical protein
MSVDVEYQPFAGPSAQKVRRALARFPGRTARDIASLAGVSLGHVYCVLSIDVDRGKAAREKDRGAFVYWPAP